MEFTEVVRIQNNNLDSYFWESCYTRLSRLSELKNQNSYVSLAQDTQEMMSHCPDEVVPIYTNSQPNEETQEFIRFLRQSKKTLPY